MSVAAGLPEPRVEKDVDRLRFTIYVPSHAPEVLVGANLVGEIAAK